jgi:uncharacterized protein (DUF2249 family)
MSWLTNGSVNFYHCFSKNKIKEGAMAEVNMMPRNRQPPGSAGTTAGPPPTLADEHVLLLRQITARAEALLAAIADGRWPGAELAALAGYAQAEVVRQVSDEEALLFPAAPSREVAGLARDHVRLRAAAELLTRAAAGEQPMPPARVAVAARDFVTQLKRHLRAEERLLAARQRTPRGVPGTVTLGGHPHQWYPLTEGPVVDLDALPPRQTVAAVADRLLRMRGGEQVELRSGVDLDAVWREMSRLSPGGYLFAVLQDGPARWRMRVTRRQSAE